MIAGVGAILLVGLGGGVGAILRLLISTLLATPGRFPWATLAINIAGSFGIGLLFGFGQQRLWFEQWGRYLVMTGLLGGFTTFSAFSLETVALLEAGRPLAAFGYVLASVIGCLMAAWLGLRITSY